MKLSPAPPPFPLTYASMSAYFGREGYSIETRTLRDLGKDLANHFFGRFHDKGPSGSRIYDNDTWDIWKDIVELKLQGKHRPRISEFLSHKYDEPIERVHARVVGDKVNQPVPVPPKKHGEGKDMLEIVTQGINREWKCIVKNKDRYIKLIREQHHREISTFQQEREVRHELYLIERREKERAQNQLQSLDVVSPKRKALLSKAAQLHPFWHRKQRNQILDELTSLELNPTEEEGG